MKTVSAAPFTPSEKSGSGTLAISHGAALEQHPNAPKTLADCLYRAAETSPDRGIVYLRENNSPMFQSYPELLNATRKLLRGLRVLGLSPGDRVILQFDQNEDFIRTFWACIWGGFVALPMSVPAMHNQSKSGLSKLRGAWEHLGHPVILSTNRIIESVRGCFNFDGSTDLRVKAIDGLSKAECDYNWHQSASDDLALLMLTSGSTGPTKAVRLSHANLISRSQGSIQ